MPGNQRVGPLTRNATPGARARASQTQTQMQSTPKAPLFTTSKPHASASIISKASSTKVETPVPSNTYFDAYNSSSTGHQLGDGGSGTAWRAVRTQQINLQFGGVTKGAKGKQRTLWEVGGVQKRSTADTAEPTAVTELSEPDRETPRPRPHLPPSDKLPPSDELPVSGQLPPSGQPAPSAQPPPPPKPLFRHVVFYINGSTAPLVSDHKLKQLIASHGGRVALGISKSVTHVVLGTNSAAGGVGGGLAAGKKQREIMRCRGAGKRFVGVEWVLDSIKRGKRLPEPGFENLKLAAHGQGRTAFGTG
ncbi:hypothetical protein EJ06DRAFT_528517 [Trichodelitschia bisporula]|uniref:BRCT domain-containing protein n=1 Tax=Trichodelitschia bisporula TaxID=703511 RepID=A0A6G1I2Q5_9PEZI|nr:hypothetical protein EJ06DRAFT_528517 [Trichodelitschia bisporula]